jgi:hypothetical protein
VSRFSIRSLESWKVYLVPMSTAGLRVYRCIYLQPRPNSSYPKERRGACECPSPRIDEYIQAVMGLRITVAYEPRLQHLAYIRPGTLPKLPRIKRTVPLEHGPVFEVDKESIITLNRRNQGCGNRFALVIGSRTPGRQVANALRRRLRTVALRLLDRPQPPDRRRIGGMVGSGVPCDDVPASAEDTDATGALARDRDHFHVAGFVHRRRCLVRIQRFAGRAVGDVAQAALSLSEDDDAVLSDDEESRRLVRQAHSAVGTSYANDAVGRTSRVNLVGRHFAPQHLGQFPPTGRFRRQFREYPQPSRQSERQHPQGYRVCAARATVAFDAR